MVEWIEDTIERLEQQVSDLGEGLGRLLWDLKYAEELGVQVVNAVVADWLQMKFSKEVMEATSELYDHPDTEAFQEGFVWYDDDKYVINSFDENNSH